MEKKKKNKIERLKPKGSLVELIEEMMQYELEIDTMVFVAKLKDGQIISGTYNATFSGMAELAGHLQIDIMNRFIKENYITPEK